MSDNPLGLQIHKLIISRFVTASLSASEADRIASDASSILSQCRIAVVRNNPQINVFTNGNGTINSESDFRNLCGTKKEQMEALGFPRRVFVVNKINWCGQIKPNVIGCAYIGGTCIVVVRFSSSLEGNLWAHEWGHARSLHHRVETGALMYPSIGSNNYRLTSGECATIRRKQITDVNSIESLKNPVLSILDNSILTFIKKSYPHGVPFEEAKKFTSVEGRTLLPLLNDSNEEDYWSNTVIVLGIIGDEEFFNYLKDFIERKSSENISDKDYSARTNALVSLGYLINASGYNKAIEYLEKGLEVRYWKRKRFKWKASYQSNLDERNADLVNSCALGLALSGNVIAVDKLKLFYSSYTSLKKDIYLASYQNSLENAINEGEKIIKIGLKKYYSNKL